MVPWRVRELVSERREFVALAESGMVSHSELCRRFGVSRQTGYVWLGRWRREGEGGLVDRSRRPLVSPSRTPVEIEALVVDLRDQHPRWGGRKISRVLQRRGYKMVPAPSTVTGILRRRGKLRAQPEPRAYQPFERAAPNELWQMDFKGWFGLGDQTRCHPFGMLDDHSRYNLALAACSNQQTATVQQLLGGAFCTYGLPQAILCDNGSPWGHDREHPWTPLGVWLLDLGVKVTHSRPLHPQTAGKEERFHLTLDWEVISTRSVWDDLATVQHAFDRWRVVYNHERPHDSLGLQVPADRYQPSPRPMPTVIVPVDYPDDYQVRKASTNAQISFNGRRIRVGKAFRGRYIGIRPDTTDGTYHLYYRNQRIRTIDLATP